MKKQELFELLETKFGRSRETYLNLRQNYTQLDTILSQGAEKARAMAKPTMEKLRRKIGIRR